MTAWWVANVASYWEVSQQFRVWFSTVALMEVEICHAMELLLLHRTVCLGNPVQVIVFFSWWEGYLMLINLAIYEIDLATIANIHSSLLYTVLWTVSTILGSPTV